MSANGISEQLVAQWSHALLADEGLLGASWKLKRWTAGALEQLSVGFDGERFTLPQRDARAQLTGVLRYAPSILRHDDEPKTLATPGSKRELFPAPESLDGDERWLFEGEPDAIAATALGLPAVGVPGTGGWKASWAKRFEDLHVYLVFDCDVPGRTAAERIAVDLLPYAASVRIVQLDPMRNDGYDLGDFVADAESPDDLRAAMKLLREMGRQAAIVEPPPKDGAIYRSAADIRPRKVEWLWQGRVPRAALTLLLGMPGLGKSMLTVKLAAEATQRGEGVVMVNAEDAPDFVIVPRLLAENAVLDRIGFMTMRRQGFEESLQLPEDVIELQALVNTKRARLIVIDPLAAHFGKDVDSFRDQSVRRALAPIVRMAEATGCAVIVVAHLNKGMSTDPILRAGGSIGIIGAARSALLFDHHPHDPLGVEGPQRVLAQAKMNLAARADSLAYELTPTHVPEHSDIDVARLVLLGECSFTARELLGLPADPGERSKIEEAIEWLRDELANGPLAVKLLQARARDAGFGWRTVETAKQQLAVTSERIGFGTDGIWSWRLPDVEGDDDA